MLQWIACHPHLGLSTEFYLCCVLDGLAVLPVFKHEQLGEKDQHPMGSLPVLSSVSLLPCFVEAAAGDPDAGLVIFVLLSFIILRWCWCMQAWFTIYLCAAGYWYCIWQHCVNPIHLVKSSKIIILLNLQSCCQTMYS